MKNTWKLIKEIINKNTNRNELPETSLISNLKERDPKLIANGFNEYFVEIGPQMANTITTNSENATFLNNLTRPTNSNFQIETINQETVKTIIDKLKPKTSSGRDKMSNILLKYI